MSPGLWFHFIGYLTFVPSIYLTWLDFGLHWPWGELYSYDLLMYIVSIWKFITVFYLVLIWNFGNFITRIASIILTFCSHWILFYSYDGYFCGKRHFLWMELIHMSISSTEIKCIGNYSRYLCGFFWILMLLQFILIRKTLHDSEFFII